MTNNTNTINSSKTTFQLSRDTLLPLLCSNKLSPQIQRECFSALCQFLTDATSLGDLSNCYLGYTELLRIFPCNPVLWYNRGLVLLEMKYQELAYWDLERAQELYLDKRNGVISSHQIYDGRFVEKVEMVMIYAHIRYTASRNLITSVWGCEYIQVGLKHLKTAVDVFASIPSSNPLHIPSGKIEELKKIGETKYREYKKRHEYDHDMITYEGKLTDGRYPWDPYDIRKKAAKTKKEFDTLTHEYNKILQKFKKTDRIEVKLSCTSMNDSKPEPTVQEIQAGFFAKKSIRTGTILIDEMPFSAVNIGLYSSRCDNCQALCPPLKRYLCPSCKEIFCSKRCFHNANNRYHKILCGRQDRFEEFYKEAQSGISTTSFTMLHYIKIFAMSLQMQIPVLELPGLRYLRPANISDSSDMRYYKPHFSRYFRILRAFEIGPTKWLDFDYWIYDTVGKLILNNSFGAYESFQKPNVGTIYEVKSWFNHSCDPNCSGVEEDKGGVISSRFIKAGEELTISYCDTALSKVERQKRLSFLYGINCTCERCESE